MRPMYIISVADGNRGKLGSIPMILGVIYPISNSQSWYLGAGLPWHELKIALDTTDLDAWFPCSQVLCHTSGSKGLNIVC